MGGGDPGSWMHKKLFERRVVLLSGPLDDDRPMGSEPS